MAQRKQWRGMRWDREDLGAPLPNLGNNNDSKWFRDQSRSGGSSPYHPSVARWPCSFWVLPTFLPVPRDQNSTFSNILQPASLIPRSKETFCPSCKIETKKQLNAVSSAFPVGWGPLLKGTSQRNTLTKGWYRHSVPRVPAECVLGEATQGASLKICPTQCSGGSKGWWQVTTNPTAQYLSKSSFNISTSHRTFHLEFKNMKSKFLLFEARFSV